jgi:hypothetical protein
MNHLEDVKCHRWHDSSATPAFAVFKEENCGVTLKEQASHAYRKKTSLDVANSQAYDFSSDFVIASES